MNIEKLYQDFGIDTAPDGHKHHRSGWVNIECPFCTGNPGYHLGFNTQSGYFRCWRCGYKPATKVISTILKLSKSEAYDLIRQYGGAQSFRKKTDEISVHKKDFRFPRPYFPLSELPLHRKYLKNRGFDPYLMEKKWGVFGTGNWSYLDKIDYSWRLMIPIYWNGEIVSFQARDVTGNSEVKYKACPKDREIINHKEILYGKRDYAKDFHSFDIVFVVEGVTDVWALQRVAKIPIFATFGIEYKTNQKRRLSRLGKQVVVIFDDDPQAIRNARKLRTELQFRGTPTISKTIQGDPGELSKRDARALIQEVKNEKT